MKRIRECIALLGLVYRVELIKFLLINFVGLLGFVLVFVFVKQIIYGFLIFGFLVVIDYFFLNRYFSLSAALDKDHENEFIELLAIFKTFICNGFNVYNSFISLKKYSSEWMKDIIDNLLRDIDEDKTVIPYIRFSKNFKSIFIEQVMTSIYQISNEGNNDVLLNQFNLLFQNFNDIYRKDKITRKTRAMENVCVFPLFGAALITIIITISIVSLVGGMISGL